MSGRSKRASFYADLDLLRSHFEALDPQKSGYIGYKELATLVQDIQGVEESMVPELMEKLDRDRDGKVSFEDFQVLFELEREETKALKSLPSTPARHTTLETSNSFTNSLQFETALDTLPSEIIVSPTGVRSPDGSTGGSRQVLNGAVPESPTVILRHKRTARWSAPVGRSYSGRGHSNTPFLSPIPSGDMPDLATQMRYLTSDSIGGGGEGGGLNRHSRVLSWISESEELPLEDTGIGSGHASSSGVSPPPSPLRGSDEASHVRAVLESVCHSQEIGREAIAQLCRHVKADPQEEQELLALLDHLDTQQQGWVSLEEFVRGLQAVKNAAVVTSTPHMHGPPPRTQQRRHSDQPIPTLSEPFSTPVGAKPAGIPLASTPLPPATKTEESTVLSVLDPDNSGYVKVDSVLSQWQGMGVEASHDQSLQDALTEVVPIDASGRMNVSELTASLEGAILSEGRTPTVLRQAALKSFKSEIVSLRTQVHQVSLERDQLRTNLNRTFEENRRLVQEGDEHVDLVTQQSEMKIQEQKERHTERLKEVERSRHEEAQMLQDRAQQHITDLEDKAEILKAEEEKLKAEFRLAQEEVLDMTKRLTQAHKELTQKEKTVEMLQRDLSVRSELGYGDDVEMQLSRISELENEISERTAHNQELTVRTQELHDRIDLLTSENEQWRQKYMSQKRKLQRRRSSISKSSDQLKEKQKRRRPSSGKERSTSRPTSTRRPKSAHIPARNLDVDSHSPGDNELEEESGPESPLFVPEVEVQFVMADGNSSSRGESSPSSDDLYTRSAASLMEEIQQNEHKSNLESMIQQLRAEKAQLETTCQEMERQLHGLEEDSLTHRDQLHRELQLKKQKQAELESHIASLEKQRKRLSAARLEIDAQLATAEDSIAKQVEDYQRLKILLTDSNTTSPEPPVNELREELACTKAELAEQQSVHMETIAKLREAIGKLERENAEQSEYSQRLEDEVSQLQDESSILQQQLTSDKTQLEEELNGLQKKLQETQELFLETQRRQHDDDAHVRRELETTKLAMTQYKQEREALSRRLEEARQALAAKEQDLREVQKQIVETVVTVPSESLNSQVNVTAEEIKRLKTALEQSQEEYARVSELNESLQLQAELYQMRLAAEEQKAEDEISKLQSQLIAAHTEISEQATLYEDEISQLKEEFEQKSGKSKQLAERRLADVRSENERQIQSIRYKHELQLEALKQELKSSELKQNALQDRLDAVEVQFENMLSEAVELKEKEADWQRAVAEYKENEEQYKNEVSQCKADLAKCREELILLRANETKYHDQISILREELLNRPEAAPVLEEVAIEAADFVEVIPRIPQSPGPRPQSRSSFISDQSVHEELFSQMKLQLSELQKLLILQGKAEEGEDEELSIVQELISNNTTLEAELQKLHLSFDAERTRHLEAISSREGEIKRLQSHLAKEKTALESLATVTVCKLVSEIGMLQDQSRQSINGYNSRIESVASTLAAITDALTDRDERHSSALDSLLVELNQSRSTIDSYRYEVDLLKSGLDQSQEDLNRSQSEMVNLHLAKQIEVEELRGQLKRSESVEVGVQVVNPPSESSDTQVGSLEVEPQRAPSFDASTQAEDAHLGATSQAEISQSVGLTQAQATTGTETETEVTRPVDADAQKQQEESKTREQLLQLQERAIQSLKGELERAKASEREAQKAQKHSAAELEQVQAQLRQAESVRQVRQLRTCEESRRVTATQVGDEHHKREIQRRDEAIQLKDKELQSLRHELESVKNQLEEAKGTQDAREREIGEKEEQIRHMDDEIASKEEQIQELQHKLDTVVSEPIEAVIQYIENPPLESVNEAVLMGMQKEVETEKERVELQHHEEVQQLQEDLNHSLSESEQHEEQLAALRLSLQEAEEELRTLRETAPPPPLAAGGGERERELQLQLRELKQKHAEELSATQQEHEALVGELRELYTSLVTPPLGGSPPEIPAHSSLVQEIRREVERLKVQVSLERNAAQQLEATLSQKTTEFDQQEAAFHVEHEEEVRALTQQKDHLYRQLEELKTHYHHLLDDQDSQNEVLLQDLVNKNAQLEGQLWEKREECHHAYKQIADLLEEKKVLMDIVEQLCLEAGKQIDMV